MKYLLLFLLIGQVALAQDNCKSFKSSWSLKRQQIPNINYNARSDTFDILHYDVELDITNTSAKEIYGVCSIDFLHILPTSRLTLDLKFLSVDSVIWNGNQTLPFSIKNEQVLIDISGISNPGDTNQVKVFYGGKPYLDPSGFGGFYFDNGYYYNLGVSFSDNPHNHGRAWHPCFDNFVERASYSFHLKTANGNKGYANGLLTNEESLGGDTIIRHWSITEEIPTYLATVAASTYETVHQEINSVYGTYPVELIARPADTTGLKNSFVNLPETFQAFESAFGPYLWGKVGYILTTRGAMEHPTAISYPLSLVNGNTTYENIMAHELAHHWWGNLVTCKTAEDMWINEGFAEYCSHLFLEYVYDKQRYIDAVESNHFEVLRTAHKNDGGFLAISGIPHENTYGTHVYNKGASVVHNLRTYMGDSAFFATMTGFLNEYKFKDVSSEDLKDYIVQNHSAQALDFFDNWVYNPGFPHFEIDSVRKTPNTTNSYQVGIKQKVYQAPEKFESVPLAIYFYSKEGDVFIDTIMGSSFDFTQYFDLAFEPDWVVLNRNNEITMAILENEHVIKEPGTYDFSDAQMKLNVSVVGGDSALVRIEQHLVAPSPIKNNNKEFRLSSTRYWTVDGLIDDAFQASTSILYDSRGTYPPDGDLAATTEDSLVLMYRKDGGYDWTEYWHYTKNVMGSSVNKVGRMDITKLIPGQYTFANGVSSIGINQQPSVAIETYPNPANELLWISGLQGKTIRLYDIQGKVILEQRMMSSKESIDVSKLIPGSYIIKGGDFSQKIEIIK